MVLQDAFESAQRFLDDVIRPEHQSEIVHLSLRRKRGWLVLRLQPGLPRRGRHHVGACRQRTDTVPRSGANTYVGPAIPPQ